MSVMRVGWVVTAMVVFGVLVGYGQTNGTTQTGNWSDPNTWSQLHVPLAGEDIAIEHDCVIDTDSAMLAAVWVDPGVTLTFSNWTTTLQATNVTVDGTISHAGPVTNNVPTNRVHILCTNLSVDSGGSIDASAKGFAGGGKNAIGTNVGQGQGGGRAADPGGSGGYGGEGCNTFSGGASGGYGETYGTATYPVGPGSGGGSNIDSARGGHGGGSIWIEASGTATVDGVISVAGGDATGGNHEGGGSGGAIYLFAGHLSGTGSLQAGGGDGRWNAGGAGGGRIHLYMGTGTELAYSVSGGGTYSRSSNYYAEGDDGTYVLNLGNLDLLVQGDPDSRGTASPYAYGYSSIPVGTWITNSVNSPADQADGSRYHCIGWALTKDGAPSGNGSTTQAVFQMTTTNTVLTFLWTNAYQLAVSNTAYGTATTSSNGWYTNGTVVAGLTTSPNPGYEFVQWSGDIAASQHDDDPLSITMDRRRNLLAHFAHSSIGSNKTFAGGEWFADWDSWSPQGVPGRHDAVTLTAGTTDLRHPASVSGLVVNSGATLRFSGWDTELYTTNMAVSGTVTHADCTIDTEPTNRVVIKSGDFLVAGSGTVDVNGRGYIGAQHRNLQYGEYSNGQGPGKGRGGVNPSGGGGHGGEGGNRTDAAGGGSDGTYGKTYGSNTEPVGPGSGGGRGTDTDGRGIGGDGGGSVWIEATGSATVDGTITADGVNGTGGHTGGGSGGAIYLHAGTLAGGGSLSADGGNGNWKSGGGGGGRVAVYFTSGSELAHSETGGLHGPVTTWYSSGSNGSYYVKLLGQELNIVGHPDQRGTPTPYGYGAHSLQTGLWVTNTVASPADEAAGVRYALTGWTLVTNGAVAATGTSTQQVFQMVAGITNTTLTYTWTNQYELTVSNAVNGTASTGLSGWYTDQVSVANIQANPSGGYDFLLWSGDVPFGDEDDNPLTVTMDQPRTVIAHFVHPSSGTTRTRSTGGDWFDDWQAWSPQGVPGPEDDVTLSGGSVLAEYPLPLRSFLITNATLTLENWDTVLETTYDVTIATNATVTHSSGFRHPEDMSNRVHIVARNVTVNGVIDASEKGFSAGRHPDTYPNSPGIDGEGPGGGISEAYQRGSGGGYGGQGGRSNTRPGGDAYGSSTNPVGPGSGGAWGANHGAKGGDGGGSVLIEATGDVTLNGTIEANGGNAGAHAGGGSGGAIWINCRDLAGPAGTHLRADGGDGNWSGGGGGGGRISIWYQSQFLYQGTNSVAGGPRTGGTWSGNTDGTNGTFVLFYNPPPAGTMILVR